MRRRDFIIKNSVAIGGLAMIPSFSAGAGLFLADELFKSHRPPVKDRTFISNEVENMINQVKPAIADIELAWMFENCYPNTLDTTVDYELIDGIPDTFIITGDIDAMWLRDSTAQVWPYMPLILKDIKLRDMIKGLINRQIKCVLKDPYANAFYKDMTKESQWKGDIPAPSNGVHERKWEVDSLCYVIRLSNEYYSLTGDKSIFTADWDKAIRLIVSTFKTEQRKDGISPYRFSRKTTAMIDAPLFEGTGRPLKPVGLISSMFRPSDDSTLFAFNIPSNLFAVTSLLQLTKIYASVFNNIDFAKECSNFAIEISNAVRNYGISNHPVFGEIYAYEVDGFGNKIFMDDANVPSLMSLSYLDNNFAKETTYNNTRKFLLSNSNPYFLKGSAAEGQASPHTGKEKIWPMGIILRAMTSNKSEEIIHCLKMLKGTHAGTGFIHEAFHKDNPDDYNRAWFAWANTLFGELIIKIYTERKEILGLELK